MTGCTPAILFLLSFVVLYFLSLFMRTAWRSWGWAQRSIGTYQANWLLGLPVAFSNGCHSHTDIWPLMLGMGLRVSHTFTCFFVQLTGDKLCCLCEVRTPPSLSRRLRHGHHMYVKSLSSRSRRDGSAHDLIRKDGFFVHFSALPVHVKKTTERGCGDTVKATLMALLF